MKTINQLRESIDTKRLTSLVRAGIFDSSKMPLLKRLLDKDVGQLNSNEKESMKTLLNNLLDQVLNNTQVYNKVKNNLQTEEIKHNNLHELPSVLILKRKAVRVYPDGQKVYLYYNDKLDTFISIPVSGISVVPAINEEILDELSKKTLGNYIIGASDDAVNESIKISYSDWKKSLPNDTSHIDSTSIKNISHAYKNVNTPTGKKKYKIGSYHHESGHGDIVENSEVELQELSKKTLGNYIIGASDDAVDQSQLSTLKSNSGLMATRKQAHSHSRKHFNRIDGIKKAATKLSEETLDERITKDTSVQKAVEEYLKSKAHKLAGLSPKQRKDAAIAAVLKLRTIKEETLDESVHGALKAIVANKQAMPVKFSDGKTMKVDHTTASKILHIHDTVHEQNKEKMINMMNHSKEKFMKVASFAMKH